MIWLEKYKPKAFSEVMSHSDTVAALSSYTLETIPNLILHGQYGHNKRTILYCLIQHLYGKYPTPTQKSIEMNISSTKINVSYLESDEMIEISPGEYGYRDRHVIQNIIKEMAQTKPILSMFGSKKKSVKIIVINDAENLSKDAQAALRRTMEVYSDHFRIFLVCSQISKIIEPIRSRCLFIRFRGFSDSELTAIIENILEKENERVEKSIIDSIVKASNGNCKRALCLIELFCFNKSENENKRQKIDAKEFKLEWESQISKISDIILTNQTTAAFALIRKELYSLLNSCIDPEIILVTLVRNISKNRFQVSKVIGALALKYEERLLSGNKPLLHLEAFSAASMSYLSSMKK